LNNIGKIFRKTENIEPIKVVQRHLNELLITNKKMENSEKKQQEEKILFDSEKELLTVEINGFPRYGFGGKLAVRKYTQYTQNIAAKQESDSLCLD
jgi:hypothetical protein